MTGRLIRVALAGTLASALLVIAPGDAAEIGSAGPEGEDWPTLIAQLQQQVYQRPGLAVVREQLAIAHNNYGVALSEQGKLDQAAEHLQEALRINASDDQFRTNLSHIYLRKAHAAYQQHRMDDAARVVDQAIAMKPDLAQAYALRGEIEYDRQRLKEAKAAWQKAIQLEPHQPEVVKRLEQVTQELPIESKFERLSQFSFDLRYEEQLDRPAGFDIRDALLEARRAVGSDFAYWPKHKLVVLIYSASSFRALRQETPDWVAGQFDGKIRIPLPGAQLDPATVKQILFHEYTHALVHDLTHGNCPVWLNEGLAELEGAKHKPPDFPHLARALEANQLVPWAQLNEQFSTALSVDDVALGYQEAHAVVHYLVQRYGFWRVRRILKALGEGKTWDAVLAAEFRMKPARLETAWQQWLPSFLSPAR